MEEDDVTPHILVCTSQAQKLAGLLGGFSGLPAPLFGGAAYRMRARTFLPATNHFHPPYSFISLIVNSSC